MKKLTLFTPLPMRETNTHIEHTIETEEEYGWTCIFCGEEVTQNDSKICNLCTLEGVYQDEEDGYVGY